jgi:hypothetical protein
MMDMCVIMQEYLGPSAHIQMWMMIFHTQVGIPGVVWIMMQGLQIHVMEECPG